MVEGFFCGRRRLSKGIWGDRPYARLLLGAEIVEREISGLITFGRQALTGKTEREI